MFTSCRRGFTLVEILIAVAIVGLLAAIAIPSYTHAKMKAKEAAVKGAVHAIQVAAQTYAVDHETPPKYLIGGEVPDATDRGAVSDPLLSGGYLPAYPRNPFVSNGAAIATLQETLDDPLRPSSNDGKESGYRFGAKGRTMGQLMGTKKAVLRNIQNGNGMVGAPTYSDFDYIPAMCNMNPPWLAGQFVYWGDGVVVGFGGWRTSANKYERMPDSYDPSATAVERFLYMMRMRYPNFTGAGTIIIVGVDD